jgi:hypothetical protein
MKCLNSADPNGNAKNVKAKEETPKGKTSKTKAEAK